MLEAEERQTVVRRLMCDVTSDITERRLVGETHCQQLIQNHLKV